MLRAARPDLPLAQPLAELPRLTPDRVTLQPINAFKVSAVVGVGVRVALARQLRRTLAELEPKVGVVAAVDRP